MIAGKDFPSAFECDLFHERRSHAYLAGNPYDPESLITGAEIEQGMTYANSRRNWPSESDYRYVVGGNVSPEDTARLAPRVRVKEPYPEISRVVIVIKTDVWAVAKFGFIGVRVQHGDDWYWPMYNGVMALCAPGDLERVADIPWAPWATHDTIPKAVADVVRGML